MANSGVRTPLYARHQPGGMFSVVDETKHSRELWFCDSTKIATGGDTVGHGRGPDSPFLTVDYALSCGEMAAGDELFLGAGHVEDGDAVLFDADLAGIRIVGLGRYGTDEMARFDFNNAASTIDISANGVTLENIKFRPAAPSVLIGIHIETDVFGTTIKGCKFSEAETAGDEFVEAIQLTSGNSGTRIIGNDIRTEPGAGAATHAVNIANDSHNVTINDNVMIGNWSTAAIAAAGTGCENIMILDNEIKVKDGEPGIELDAATFGIVARNNIVSTGLAPDLMIVAALCALVENFGVTIDGDTGILIGPAVDATPAHTDLGNEVVRGTGVVPQTGTLPLFTVGTGDVLITAIVGSVDTNNFGAVANATHLSLVPTTGQASPLCTTLDLTGTTIGTQLGISGVVADTLQKHAMVLAAPVVAQIGTINMDCAGSEANATQVQWTIYWKPLVAGATVVAA